MANVHCRCRACGARQTKPKAPEEYVTAPVCRRCKAKWYRPRNLGKNVVCSPVPALRVDTWANARSWRKHTCYCDGYHHPHRIGSRWCYENPCYGHTKDELGTERSPFYHQHDEEEDHEQYCTDGEPGDGACLEYPAENHGEGGVVPPRAWHEHTDPGRRAGYELQQPVTQTTGESDMDNSRHSSVPPPVRGGPAGRTVDEKLKGVHAWREDVFGWLPGVVEEIT